MNVIDIIVVILLIFSFLNGLKEGVVKSLSSLAALLIAIPATRLTYGLAASVLSFLPGEDWQNFIGFFITMGIIMAILHLIFFIPRKIVGAVWKEGVLFRALGGVFNLTGGIIGMVVFVLVTQTYPIFGWLEGWVSDSGVLSALVNAFSFIHLLLPSNFRGSIL